MDNLLNDHLRSIAAILIALCTL